MSSRLAALAAAAVLLLPAGPAAIFVRTESKMVPVERLVANLERDVIAAPRDAAPLTNLARLHAMAYALKSDVLLAQTEGTAERPFYPPGTSRVPETVRPATSAEHKASADRHLKEATRHYEAALALAPLNIAARLGHGWVLEQSGEKAKAIDEYRRVIELAWPSESTIKTLGPGQRLYTQEAARYLIPLLDPGRDRDEVRDLTAKQDAIKAKPRAITPIAIPLADNVPVAQIVDPLARVRFDADGSKLGRRWTWITPQAGWLVYDANGTGRIDSALQLFGSVTFWLFWSNGYEAMRALDDNDDGELSGSELRHLGIWHDRNSNGISDVGEVRPLAAFEIVALSCRHVDGDGSRVAAAAPQGVRFADGRTRPSYDVILRHSDLTSTRR